MAIPWLLWFSKPRVWPRWSLLIRGSLVSRIYSGSISELP